MIKTPKTFTINIKPPEPVDIKKQNAIKKIDKSVFKRSLENGLQLKQAQTINDYLLNPKTMGSITASYKLNHPNASQSSADSLGSRMLDSVKVQKTIQEIMTDNRLTNNNLITSHKEYRDKSANKGDYNIAIKANQDFLKIAGILKNDNTTPVIAVQVVNNINKMQPDEIDSTLNELLKE